MVVLYLIMGPNPRLIDLFIVLQQQGLIARIFHVHMKLFFMRKLYIRMLNHFILKWKLLDISNRVLKIQLLDFFTKFETFATEK